MKQRPIKTFCFKDPIAHLFWCILETIWILNIRSMNRNVWTLRCLFLKKFSSAPTSLMIFGKDCQRHGHRHHRLHTKRTAHFHCTSQWHYGFTKPVNLTQQHFYQLLNFQYHSTLPLSPQSRTMTSLRNVWWHPTKVIPIVQFSTPLCTNALATIPCRTSGQLPSSSTVIHATCGTM